MKGELTLKLLGVLEKAAYTVGDIAYLFTLPYGSSLGRMQKSLMSRQSRRANAIFETSKGVSKQRLHELMHRLLKDGLIKSKNRGKNRLVSITWKGKSALETLRREKSSALPPTHYSPSEEDLLKIIIFDIPERERRKRNWLRIVLRNLEFTMLQKSVWAGKTKLPKEFLESLERLKLLDYVEIFAISKTGSLKQLTP